MFFRAPLFSALLFAFILPCAAEEAAKPADGEAWTEIVRKPDLVIYSRLRKDTSVKEFKAVGTIAAPNWVVKNVIDDAEAYPQFMPYVAESKILARENGDVITYQHLNTPFVHDRDYILRIHCETRQLGGGRTVYLNRWHGAEAAEPAERSGIVRVKNNEGSWLLEPNGMESTRATYTIFTDSGGSIPAMVLNFANEHAIPKLFAAIEKQALEKKYREKKPAQ